VQVRKAMAMAVMFGAMETATPGMGTAQVQYTIPAPPSPYPGISERHRPMVREHQLMMLNELRQERVVSDSAKLLQLATELKTNTDKPPVNQVPLQMIRQTKDIEKLAHDVKQQMRG
jgi:hypothetical protein